MYGVDSLFAYYTRRAQQERDAAARASCPAAALSHAHLSLLLFDHAGRCGEGRS